MNIRPLLKPCGLAALILAGLFTCTDKQTTAPENVLVVPVISWKSASHAAVPSGVDSIRISISSSALTSSLVKTFAFNDSQGTIPSVPADIGITIVIEGIDSAGHVIYRGSVAVARVIAPKMEITIEADQVTPVAPSDLIVQALSSGSVRLIWKENSSNESYYLIDRRKSSATAWDSIGTATQNLFMDSGLTPVTVYNYRIYAVNAAGKSLEAVSGTGTTLFLDSTGPQITISQYAKNDTVNSRTITLYGAVRDTSGVFQVMLNDIVAQLNGNQWIKQNYYLADSINRIIIKATDNSPRKNTSLDTLTIVYKSTYVDTVNHSPIFTVISDSMRATVRVGQTYRKLLRGMDPDAQDTIRFTVSSPLTLMGKDTVLWTPTISDTGIKSCYALIFDKKQAHDSLAWTITVIDSTTHVPNHAPAFVTTVSDLRDSIRQNSQYSDTLIANDADAGQPLAFSIVTGPTGLMIGASSGIITWTPTPSGVFPVTARVTDDSSAHVDLAWTITVVPATTKQNHPPQFVTQSTDLTAIDTVGKPYRDTVTATDQDSGAVLRYSIVNGPVTIDSVSGIITWTPTAAGNYSITARVRDDSSAHADVSWTISVKNAIIGGLVAWYPFNGNANDESGKGNNGTVYGATLTTDRFGNSNAAYTFDGSSYIEVPDDNTLDFVKTFTIAAWVKISTLNSSYGTTCFVGKSRAPTLGAGYAVRFERAHSQFVAIN